MYFQLEVDYYSNEANKNSYKNFQLIASTKSNLKIVEEQIEQSNALATPLHDKKNFRLTKICEKDRKDHIFVGFRMFPFHGNIILS